MFKIIKGAEYFKNGILNFPPSTTPPTQNKNQDIWCDGSYRTIFGPSISHDGVIYANNDKNVSLAFSRLTASRLPDCPGMHDHLKNVQRHYINNNKSFLSSLRDKYTTYFSAYNGADLEALAHHDDPHQKRALRKQAWDELNATGDRYVPDRWVTSVGYKMKKNEIAKPNKVPRMIGDLGVSASLWGFYLTKLLKNAQASEIITVQQVDIHFVASPAPDVLQQVFRTLIEPVSRGYFVCFSDDSCFAIRYNNEVHWYNVDISKCDASHTEALFTAIQDITPTIAYDDMCQLTAQCALPLRIVSVADPKNIVLLQPKHQLLYSGSTLTTAINTLASTLIGKAFAECAYTGPDSLIAAALTVGYIITLDRCHCIEDIQFLKHSPVLDLHGAIQPLLNLGVLLRLSGTCDGDLPGRGDIIKRALSFQNSLLTGAFPYATFKILENLRSRTEPATQASTSACERLFEHKVLKVPNFEPFVVDEQSMYRRYRLDDLDISDLLEFSRAGVLHHFAGDAATKVLIKDYGLKSLSN